METHDTEVVSFRLPKLMVEFYRERAKSRMISLADELRRGLFWDSAQLGYKPVKTKPKRKKEIVYGGKKP